MYRSWADAASSVLYDSIALYGGATATLFNRTIEECPQRAYLVRTLLLAPTTPRRGAEAPPTRATNS